MPLSLQISLTPLDIPHAALILPHQLRIWAAQASEILLIWDLDPGPRYERQPAYREKWDSCKPYLEPLNQALKQDWPDLKIETLIADEQLCLELSQRFFRPDTGPIPAKDYRGGPFAAYFYGLAAAAHDLVLHLDADMMFGGQSPSWAQEACISLQAAADLLCIAPPGGPPGTEVLRHRQFTTRSFLLDRRRLQGLELSRRELPELLAQQNDQTLWVEPYAEMPEILISHWMQAQDLWRLDLPGQAPGIWSLHPPVPADPRFHVLLPELLRALDTDSLPATQQGHYNLLPATLDTLSES